MLITVFRHHQSCHHAHDYQMTTVVWSTRLPVFSAEMHHPRGHECRLFSRLQDCWIQWLLVAMHLLEKPWAGMQECRFAVWCCHSCPSYQQLSPYRANIFTLSVSRSCVTGPRASFTFLLLLRCGAWFTPEFLMRFCWDNRKQKNRHRNAGHRSRVPTATCAPYRWRLVQWNLIVVWKVKSYSSLEGLIWLGLTRLWRAEKEQNGLPPFTFIWRFRQ